MKKLLSVILVFSLVFSASPIFSVLAATPIIQDDLKEVQYLDETLADSTRNLTLNWGNSTTRGEALTFYTTKSNAETTNGMFSISNDHASKMTDGLLDTRGDMGGHLWFDHNNELAYVEGYIDVNKG